ncbi:unnamed protein product [Acanthoscelides obtectus]|uniref:CCHC-type domain-containing protein n=1 Tax=Acanthoscelides obtectus TaxID=200917 RepID=A0A9P0K4B3_ACAOB|nr:unnamed protein product [Acanthoscelides obtectus]CAK1668879.1 hypothetical protein AOBTE_LOCUS26656 [Acanthoscelides obtectus]
MAKELAKSLGAIASILENLQRKVDDNGTQSSAAVIQKTPISLALPSFDPDSTDSHVWLQKIEGYKNEFGWSDRETVSRIGPFLLKSAQGWFSVWQPTEETWENFKIDFSVSFPKQKNLGKLLSEAVGYHSSEACSYVEYARVTLEKLKRTRAGWVDLDLIEIIAHSIDGAVVRTAAYNCGASSVSDLIAFLANYIKVPSFDKMSTHPNSQSDDLPRKNSKQISCYSCGKIGHFSRECKSKAFPIHSNTDAKTFCRYCKKPGHEISHCFRRQDKRARDSGGETSVDKKFKGE